MLCVFWIFRSLVSSRFVRWCLKGYIHTFQLALSGARIGVRWTINAMKPCRTYRLKTLGSHNWAWAMGQYLWHSNLKTSRGGKEHAVNIQGKSKIVEVEDVAVDRWSTSPLFIWLQPSFWCRNSHPSTHQVMVVDMRRGCTSHIRRFIRIGSLEVQSTLCFLEVDPGAFKRKP